MLGVGAIARRVRAPLSRVVWSRYSTYDAEERVYTVRLGDAELVGPASLTPRETKPLSDLDDMDINRKNMSLALFYRGREEDSVHPAGVIRRALGEALVHYYPLAGRLREIEGGKLAVDCTGEGVLFMQADAEVRLAELEAAAGPPFPGWDQLLFDVEGSGDLLHSPLMLIQVTRLLCGGFVLAIRFSHTMCDGIGIGQFMNSVGELARGLPSMTVTPVWSRELIKAATGARRRRPESEVVPPAPPPPPQAGSGCHMVRRSFNFSASHVAEMKKSLHPQVLGATATTFETLTAFVWRAHTAALELPPGEDAPLAIVVNSRGGRMWSLPAGYYGNAAVISKARIDGETLCRGSLGHAVALVRLAKAAVTREYVGSFVDEATMSLADLFLVTDARRLGLASVDLGWGEPVFAGPVEPLVYGWSCFIAGRNRDGEDAVRVPVVLPPRAILRFAAQVERSQLEA